jgi:hypothetical protein
VGCSLPDGIFQCDDLLLADISAHDARVRAVTARVWAPLR